MQLDDFDHFWHIQAPQSQAISTGLTAPYEPLVVRGKGRPKGALNLEKRGTRRDPSAHEIVESFECAEATRAGVLTTTKNLAATVTSQGLRYLQHHGDTYEPGTHMQRAYQRAACRTPVSDDEEPAGDSQAGSSQHQPADHAQDEIHVAIPSQEPSHELSQDAEHKLFAPAEWEVMATQWDKAEVEVQEEGEAQQELYREGLS